MTLRSKSPTVLQKLFKVITGAIDTLLPIKKPERTIEESAATRVFEKYKPIFDSAVYDLSGQLVEGKISPREWKAKVSLELRYLMLTAAAAGVGGIGRLTKEDLQSIDDTMIQQGQFLENFVAEIERMPKEKLDQPKIATRLSKYFGSAKPVLEQSVAISKGRPKLPFQPAERTNCMGNCKCEWKWVDINPERGDWDVYWEMSLPAEHCKTCKTRAEVCNPLQIRDREIKTDLSNPNLERH